MSLELLHPITRRWFEDKFGAPTEPQRLGWPSIARGENTLIAAPTGSGKTLTAFLVCIDRLVREAIDGHLDDECRILYISPLKALASDIKKNLETPLAEIQARVMKKGIPIPPIRSAVRTGDTPAHERQKIVNKPPHILVTTPESFYLLLTTEKGRNALRTVQTVIVDEIHALARDKRGSHLALSLERLKAITRRPPVMIGLSATQKPVEEIASFLVGTDKGKPGHIPRTCNIFDIGHSRDLDLNIIVPGSPLNTVASNEQWEEIYQLIAQQINSHRSTLLFVNTRRLAERVAFRLQEVLGEEQVLCHHGSLSKNRRLTAENMLKEGKLKAIVATASLELGIDIGYIDLVCQIGIPFSIATFLQRIGRSGHAIKATPKGRLIPLTRDELLESMALIRAVKEKNLDRIEMPVAPLDILTQQIIAECAGRASEGGMSLRETYDLFCGAWPYRDLTKEKFLEVVRMASDGFAPERRRFAYLMWDRLKNRLSVKAGARIAAVTSGGAIPEMGDYRVVLEDDSTMVGTVNEDFAIESMKGDIFLLGTHSWQVVQVRGSEVVVRDAHGQPPTIPFWLGEAPGRTKEFSEAVFRLRKEIGEHLHEDQLKDTQLHTLEALSQIKELATTPFDPARDWLRELIGIENPWILLQAVHYIAVQKAAMGMIPTQQQIVFERFFDEIGGQHLVIHSPYGARVNRGWGLALRKRFCRAFDFELQASADDDGIVLSLGPNQSFPLETLFKMLNDQNVRHFLIQALLAAPMFGARWRWNVTRALAVLRQMKGKRVAPALQRFRSEDLLTAVFPAQTACQENAPGDIEIPDHPLVKQTVHDCLTEAMDIEGLEALFRRIQAGEVKLIAKETREPSPFAYQLVNGYKYAFLDDAPLEDRRTRSVNMRQALSLEELKDLDRMDSKAIEQVRKQAWPEPKSADEWYETLVATPGFPYSRTEGFREFTDQLLQEKRAVIARGQGFELLVAAESIPTIKTAYDSVEFSAEIELPETIPTPESKQAALQSILKGWLEIRGPISVEEFQEFFGVEKPELYLEAIETTGAILRCRLEPTSEGYPYWCTRNLLRRIHRLTVEGLREQIRPVAPADYLEFILEEHGLNLAGGKQNAVRGADELVTIFEKLQGFEAPALAWERELLSSRMEAYETTFLDQLTSRGLVSFGRVTPKKSKVVEPGRGQKVTSVVPLTFALRRDWAWIAMLDEDSTQETLKRISSAASQVWEALKAGGAQFIDEIESTTRLLETQVENALSELASEGLITCDQFEAFREILSPQRKEKERALGSLRLGRKKILASEGGRWAILRKPEIDRDNNEDRVGQWAAQLLLRYGIVFRDLLERETLAPSWGELVREFRRLEARGEVRGGRFITGVSGEQFGLSETHERLMRVREERAQGKRQGSYAVISSADPLNLIGIVTKADKISSGPSTRILIEAGEVSAVYRKNQIETKKEISEERLRALRLIGTFRSRARVATGFPRRIQKQNNIPLPDVRRGI